MFTAYEDGKSDREKGYVLAMPPAEPRKMKYQKTKQHETYHYLPNLTVTQSCRHRSFKAASGLTLCVVVCIVHRSRFVIKARTHD